MILIDILHGEYYNKTIQTQQYAGLLLGLDSFSAEMYVKQCKNLFAKKEVLPEDLLLAYGIEKAWSGRERARKNF